MICINNIWYEEKYMETRSENMLASFHAQNIPDTFDTKIENINLPVLLNKDIQEHYLTLFLKEDLYTSSFFITTKGEIGLRWVHKVKGYFLFQESLWQRNIWYIYELKLIEEDER